MEHRSVFERQNSTGVTSQCLAKMCTFFLLESQIAHKYIYIHIYILHNHVCVCVYIYICMYFQVFHREACFLLADKGHV